MPNFNTNPFITVGNVTACDGAHEIVRELRLAIAARAPHVVVFDYYHGVDETYLFENVVSKLGADLLIDTNEAKWPEAVIQEKFGHFITEDRCNGVWTTAKIDEFFDAEKVAELRGRAAAEAGLVVVYGVGAEAVVPGDLLVYCDIEMEEVKRRYRAGMDNWGAGNHDEEFLRKEKRFTVLECRVQDWHKRPLLERLDYIVDCNKADRPVMLNATGYRAVVDAFCSQPFQAVPFFQPGIWGGHWLKDKLGVGLDMPNTAWGMIGVLEFQAVQAKVGDSIFTMPGKNIYLTKPLEFLGGQVFYTWGYKMPLTVDILDTWGGQNLSLQCHPTIAYNQETFNCPYGHYESYYMLDTTDRSSVFLGTKDGVKIPDFVEALNEAQETGEFDETQWVNRWPMKKHDHVFIPSGTVHCSGADTLVLEINTFWVATFKLWDWGRVDFDGKPRPIDIGHGEKVLQQRHDTAFTRDHLISKRVEVDRGDGWTHEHSGLMEYETLHVERYWFERAVPFDTKETVKAMVLVEGEEAMIVSPNDAFEPFVMHYAEPIFIPAGVGSYYVKPTERTKGQRMAVLEIYQDLGSRY